MHIIKSHHLFQIWLIKIPFTIQHRNIRNLATELYKFLQGLPPPIFNELFCRTRFNYNLLINNFLSRQRENSMRYGIEWECPCRLCKVYIPLVGCIWVTKIKKIILSKLMSISFSKVVKMLSWLIYTYIFNMEFW